MHITNAHAERIAQITRTHGDVQISSTSDEGIHRVDYFVAGSAEHPRYFELDPQGNIVEEGDRTLNSGVPEGVAAPTREGMVDGSEGPTADPLLDN